MLVKIITSTPEVFPGILGTSLCGSALKAGLWHLDIINLRDFGITKHLSVDDTPFGGGPGMVVRADVLGKAIEFALRDFDSKIVYMSPRGVSLNHSMVENELANDKIIIICGRFEGIDERILDVYNVLEVSIGDYVLSCGELAAMVMLDACIRYIPGVLGNSQTLQEESFSIREECLLEYPQYTKPRIWKDIEVPNVLISGNHKSIEEWRYNKALEITKKRRPDLIK